MISGANILLLDEPTNHLDMESITALNEALKDFTGALLFTSQDHQFVQTTANRIMEITPNGLIDKNVLTTNIWKMTKLPENVRLLRLKKTTNNFIVLNKNTEILSPISVFLFLFNFPDRKYLRTNVLLHLSYMQ